MTFSHSVQASSADVTSSLSAMRARVRVLRTDPFGAFVRAVAREDPRRITIVSPWINDDCDRVVTLAALVRHAVRRRAAIVLVTRPPLTDTHAAAVQIIREAPKSRIYFNQRLHAKLYVCESRHGRGLAVVGSANGTGNSAFLDEIAVLLRPERGSNIISELAGPTVRGLIDRRVASR
jgi:hypothetical protein